MELRGVVFVLFDLHQYGPDAARMFFRFYPPPFLARAFGRRFLAGDEVYG
jgi:hypothetical protein